MRCSKCDREINGNNSAFAMHFRFCMSKSNATETELRALERRATGRASNKDDEAAWNKLHHWSGKH